LHHPIDLKEVVIPWTQQVLVVANQTASSDELMRALLERSERTPTAVHLIVPAPPLGGGRESATAACEAALARFRAAGLEADGSVGHVDPFLAVMDVWDPRRHDEILVSTLPIGVSKWLSAGLPQRIERATGAVVTHVVSRPAGPVAATHPAPVRESPGILGPLSVLGWGPGKRV
jgi:hypothetical protein